MFSKIKFKTGPSPGALPIEIDAAPITLFVGPNNSGKSRVLVELGHWSTRGIHYPGGIIIDNVLFKALSVEEVNEVIVPLISPSELSKGQKTVQLVGNGTYTEIDLERLYQYTSNPETRRPNHIGEYAYLRTLYTRHLDGVARLNLLDDQLVGDFQNPQYTGRLDKLFRNNILRSKLRDILFDAIGKYLVIDPTKLGTLRVRFSKRPPNSEGEERGITDEAIAFHGAAEDINKVSDGVKAFAGIMTTIVADDPKIILIDEPEAFLHPALAMRLGKEIGRSTGNNKQLLVATHSAAFVMGCIQSGAAINIVRLTYKSGVATTRVLDKAQLLHLMRNPILRSTGVLNGLFYDAVVVTEADADRAFYQEINERLISANDPRGISNCLFINAQSKQTVFDIVKPLRQIGIPTIGVVDLDMVKDGGGEFMKIMDGSFVPPMQHRSMTDMRAQIKTALDISVPTTAESGDVTKNWWKRNGGINLLDSSNKQAAETYFSQLEEFGAFVVRYGELEYWLRYLNVPANKKRWLPDVFVAMGEDPASQTYVNPQVGDVWGFIGRMKQWIDNPVRFGIPD